MHIPELSAWRKAVGPEKLEEMKAYVERTNFEDPLQYATLMRKIASWVAGGLIPSKTHKGLLSACKQARDAGVEAKKERDRKKAIKESRRRARRTTGAGSDETDKTVPNRPEDYKPMEANYSTNRKNL